MKKTTRMVTTLTLFFHSLLNQCSGTVAVGLRDEIARSVPGLEAALDQSPV